MTSSARAKQVRDTADNSALLAGKSSRSRLALLLLSVLLCSLCSAAREPIAELRERADSAQGSACAKLCLETAHALIEESFFRLKQGDAEAAQADVQDAIGYAQRGAWESMAWKKHRKETEISLRSLERRLTDFSRLLEVEQRAPLESDIALLEQLRLQLLSSLFNLKAEQE